MNQVLKNEDSIRDYLLGRVADEATLAEFEELLFGDEEFCALAEITEDALINDFVFGRMDARDRADFATSLGHSRTRSEKVKLAKAIREKANEGAAEEPEPAEAFIDAVKAFFRKPFNSLAFALVLVGIVTIFYFLPGPARVDDLAQLKEVYSKERPTDSRLDEFGYAPVVTTRGAAEELEKTRLRRIELELLEAAEKKPTAKAHHSVGVFYVTQRKFAEAIAALERAVALNDKNAQFRNDLGVAFFEKGKSLSDGERLTLLGTANEHFSKAVALDRDFLPALFNLALCRQELELENEARAAWKDYLERDGKTGWADEARKNLARLDAKKAAVKTNAEVLGDLLDAFRAGDENAAWQTISQSRDVVSGKWPVEQITLKMIDARIRGDDLTATASLDVLRFIGRLEESRNADFFVSEIAGFYAGERDWRELERAKRLMRSGIDAIVAGNTNRAVTDLDASRRAFEELGSRPEAALANLWKAHALTDDSKYSESDAALSETAAVAAAHRYRWLRLQVAEWQANNYLFHNEISRSNEILAETVNEAREVGDVVLERKILKFLAANFVESGEFEKAIAFLGRTRGRAESLPESESLRWAINFHSAESFLGLGKHATAADFAREALAIGLGGNLRESQVPSDTYRLLIKLAREAGDLEGAGAFAEDGLRSAEATKDSGLREKLRNYCLVEIADLKLESLRFAEALDDYQNIIDYWDSQPENQIDRYRVHKGKLLSLHKLGRRDDVSAELQILLKLTEQYRRTLFEEDIRNTFFDHEQVVFDVAIENYLAEQEFEKAFESAETARARSLFDKISATDEKSSNILKPFAAAEIRAALRPHQRMLFYSVLSDRVVIWIASPGSLETVEAAVRPDELKRLITDFLKQIVNGRGASGNSSESGAKLFDLLIAPARQHLLDAREIIIVPDKDLNRIPFSALFARDTGRFLVEDFAVVNAPGASVFVAAGRNAARMPNNAGVLSVGDPKFDRVAHPLLAELPAAAAEASEIASMYDTNVKLLGADATKEKLVAALDEQSVFHFAGHFVVNDAVSANSRLPLTGGELTIAEIGKRRLNKTRLVVLSACETGVEKIFDGEGAIGAARSFLAAGAPSVVASVWKVESETTKDLMIAFHRELRAGKTPAEALRTAQIGLLRMKTPFYWAAFGVYGAA